MCRRYTVIGCATIICVEACNACPTCVGRITKQSEPFFSDACYAGKEQPKNKITNQEKGTTPDKGVRHDDNE